MNLEPIIKISCSLMENPKYSIEVFKYLLGQFRVQLIFEGQEDPFFCCRGIVRQMCTYKHETLVTTIHNLRSSKDPEEYCEGLAKPWNCEGSGGRIRLDNTEDQLLVGRCAQR